MPGILWRRLQIEATTSFGGWRKILVIPAIAGLFLLGAPGWFALITGLLLYLGYLAYAHETQWTVYYLEATPVIALTIALGLQRLLAVSVGPRFRSGLVGMLAAGTIMLVAAPELAHARRFRAAAQRPYREFASQVMKLGAERTLIFLRYGPDAPEDVSLLRNVADPERAPRITAYDLGPDENARVAASYPGRIRYIWDDPTKQLLPAN